LFKSISYIFDGTVSWTLLIKFAFSLTEASHTIKAFCITDLGDDSSREVRDDGPVVVGGLLLGPADQGDVAQVQVDPVEDLAAQVDLALVEPVQRVLDVLDGAPQRGELLGQVA
jgi:hypothetical protein